MQNYILNFIYIKTTKLMLKLTFNNLHANFSTVFIKQKTP